MIFRRASLVWCVSILIVANLPAVASETPEDDVLMKALVDELDRSLTLQLEDLEKPYFVQYTVNDSTAHRIFATCGAVVYSLGNRSRRLNAEIRVGSYDLDSGSGGVSRAFPGSRGAPGSGPPSLGVSLPIEDDYAALRQAVWLASDTRYRAAVALLTRKRAAMANLNLSDRPADFTEAPPVRAVEPRVELGFDKEACEKTLRTVSARFLEHKGVERATVNLTVNAGNRYVVNSDGSRVRSGRTSVVLTMTLAMRAGDGEAISDTRTYFVESPKQLPDEPKLLAEVDEFCESLARAINAPVLDDYAGPVLFEGFAAAQLFNRLLAGRVAGQARQRGFLRTRSGGRPPFAQPSGVLDDRWGKRILPKSFQVYDDPRPKSLQDTFLAGHYRHDDEGIEAQRVDVVVDGILEDMVMSRVPTKHLSGSNGHGRRGPAGTRASIACLYVESNNGQSPEELKKALIEAADDEGLEYGIRVTALAPGSSASSFAQMMGRGGSGVGNPIHVFKVYVEDGREEPVRGCRFGPVDLRSLRDIIAAGNTSHVHNKVISSSILPSSSVIAPAVLFEELELTKLDQDSESKPILKAPHARSD
jgi:predicted Zn-dependent protease